MTVTPLDILFKNRIYHQADVKVDITTARPNGDMVTTAHTYNSQVTLYIEVLPYNLPSALCNMISALCFLLSALCFLPCDICSLLSALFLSVI
jgi:hypothetical protein